MNPDLTPKKYGPSGQRLFSEKQLQKRLVQKDWVTIPATLKPTLKVRKISLTTDSEDSREVAQAKRAAEIYFGQNKFHFSSGYVFSNCVTQNRAFARLLRKIRIVVAGFGVNHCSLLPAALALPVCVSLEDVTIEVDEARLIKSHSSKERGFSDAYMVPTAIDRQLNLTVLRDIGIENLRKLRIPHVSFTDLASAPTQPPRTPRGTGPIPGGILETVVAKEMMTPPPAPITTPAPIASPAAKTTPALKTTPRKRKRSSSEDYSNTINKSIRTSGGIRRSDRPRRPVFYGEDENSDGNEDEIGDESQEGNSDEDEDEHQQKPDVTPSDSAAHKQLGFLDLPSEIRNLIYDEVLIVDGKINPSKQKPTSEFWARSASDAPQASVLALLQTNKGVHNEGVGIYYGKNEFVFYRTNQMLMFLASISDKRKAFINKVTLWYEYEGKRDVYTMDVAVTALESLPALKALDLVTDRVLLQYRTVTSIQGVDSVRNLVARKGIDVHLVNHELDRWDLEQHWDGWRRTATFASKKRKDMIHIEKLMRGEATAKK